MAGTLTVADVARKLGAEVEGNGEAPVSGIAGVRDAGPGDISFIAAARYAREAASTRAAALIVGKDWNRPCPAAIIRVDHPDRAFTEIAELFAPPPVVPVPGVHPTAVVAAEATLGDGVSIGPHGVVEAGARLGARTVLLAGAYVGRDVVVGEDCILYQHVCVRERSRIGDRTIIHSGAVVGSDGFGYVVDEHGVRTKIPQIGMVEIGSDVEIGANVTIDRARFGKTRIGHGVKIDNLVQIAHNVVIGDHAVVVAQVGIAGSSEVGPHAILAGQVGVAGHLTIGRGAIVEAQSGLWKDVPPGERVFGYPALPQKQAMSIQRQLMRLPQLKERVVELEKRLEALEKDRS